VKTPTLVLHISNCRRQIFVAEKTLCWLGFIPVLVFDCVALLFEEGKVVCFPERKGACFSCSLGNV
jgi:hypothetical protein